MDIEFKISTNKTILGGFRNTQLIFYTQPQNQNIPTICCNSNFF